MGPGYEIFSAWINPKYPTLNTALPFPTFSKTGSTDFNIFDDWWIGAGAVYAITSVDGDNTIYDGQTVNIVGTGFGGTQGLVYLDSVEQSINSWTDTLISITVDQGGLSLGLHNIKVFKPV